MAFVVETKKLTAVPLTSSDSGERPVDLGEVIGIVANGEGGIVAAVQCHPPSAFRFHGVRVYGSAAVP